MFKRLSVVVVLLLQFQCITARSQSAVTRQSEHRKTSTPYTGDLSIFDAPGRDERLQINRVMEMLGIEPGKNLADIGRSRSRPSRIRTARLAGFRESRRHGLFSNLHCEAGLGEDLIWLGHRQKIPAHLPTTTPDRRTACNFL